MEATEILKASRVLSDRFLEFVNHCISPFHVVHWWKTKLLERGFKELVETENWQLQKAGKYFFTRNCSTIVAFDIGKDFDINNAGKLTVDAGFKIVGAHTDSPCLRLAPVSKMTSADFHQTCVSTYGGGLWHTWFDRTLRLGGKVVYNNGDAYTTKLWQSSKALLKVPNLAIHLTEERKKFEPNTESHLRPILSSEIYKQLLKPEPKVKKEDEKGIYKKHYSGLVDLIANDLGINANTIMDFDLYFADSNPAGYFGLNDEYISSPRLDNLFSSFHSMNALIESENVGRYINMVALFDHEECGSESAQGAGSNIIHQAIERIFKLMSGDLKTSDGFEKLVQKSFVISADMAHGLHPNYSDKHQSNHRVEINKGIVIKTNVNQRYATDSASAAIIQIIAEKANVPVQDFIVKNDSPCGSTIGTDWLIQAQFFRAKPVLRLWTSELRCSACIPSERPAESSTDSTTATCSSRSSRTTSPSATPFCRADPNRAMNEYATIRDLRGLRPVPVAQHLPPLPFALSS